MRSIRKILSILLILVFALTACTSPAGNNTATQNSAEANAHSTYQFSEEITADVIVVGGGTAGLMTAISAVEDGAQKVVILEKSTMTGGALNATGGTISAAKTKIQELDGLTEDTIESYKQDIINEGKKDGGQPNEELIDVYVNNANVVVDWLWEHGLKDNEFSETDGKKSVIAPEHTPYSYPRSYKPLPKDPKKYKSAVLELLNEYVAKESKIEIRYQTEGIAVLPNAKGQVLSVAGKDLVSNKLIKFSGTKGIVVATGGYAANPKLMGHYNELAKWNITGGLPTADGNGLRLVQEVGAQLTDNAMGWIPTYPMGLENPSAEGTGIIMTTKTQFFGGILVNTKGERFVNETSSNVEREIAQEKQPEGIQWEIYTDKIAADMTKEGVNPYWNGMFKSFFASPAGEKYILKANTLEELAKQMDVDPNTFTETVKAYNESVKKQETDAFGRSHKLGKDNLFCQAVNTIEGKQFYAVKIKPLCLMTMGGIKVNTKFQVVDSKANAIPGLYAAGEIVGGIWGKFPSSGTGVTGALTMGYLAGKNVMKDSLADGYKPQAAENLLSRELFEKAEKAAVLSFDMSKPLKDGVYTASEIGMQEIAIEVTIEGGKLKAINIKSQDETPSIGGQVLEKMPMEMVKSNSVNVDGVSGATITTTALKKAVIQCLEKAAQ